MNKSLPAFKPKTTEDEMISNNDSSIDSSDLMSESNVDRGTTERRTDEEEIKELVDAPSFYLPQMPADKLP